MAYKYMYLTCIYSIHICIIINITSKHDIFHRMIFLKTM